VGANLHLHAELPQSTVLPFSQWKALMQEVEEQPATGGLSLNEATFELHVLLALECRPGSDLARTGGLLIHYYNISNCGVITHILPPKDRPLDTLLNKARSILDRCARERGFLSGCNAGLFFCLSCYSLISLCPLSLVFFVWLWVQ
jgi:hypothetical protein